MNTHPNLPSASPALLVSLAVVLSSFADSQAARWETHNFKEHNFSCKFTETPKVIQTNGTKNVHGVWEESRGDSSDKTLTYVFGENGEYSVDNLNLGTYKLDNDTSPAYLDVILPNGRVIRGLYEFKKGNLRLLQSDVDKPGPRSFRANLKNVRTLRRLGGSILPKE